MKIDFDQVFADATWQGEFDPSIHDGLRHVGRNFITKTTEQQNTVPNLLRRGKSGCRGGNVNRAHKSDRLPNLRSVLREPALLPYFEPVAIPVRRSDLRLHCWSLRRIVCQSRLRKAITPGQFSITIVGSTLPPRSVSRSLRLRSRKVGGWLRGCGHRSTGDPIAGLLSRGRERDLRFPGDPSCAFASVDPGRIDAPARDTCPARRAGAARRLYARRRCSRASKRLNKVRAADDADDLVVLDDRHTLDPMTYEQSRNI
jgi:hypothetical protein